MKQIKYGDIYFSDVIIKDAILHSHPPFIKDYLLLHILLRIYNPRSVFEIGTHIGEGTNIICNAVPEARVYSLDLPTTKADRTLQHPVYKNMVVGEMCKRPFVQLWADSTEYPYHTIPCEAYFIDGEHDYFHVKYETTEALKQNPKLIIWHDADMEGVRDAILDSFEGNDQYELFRVEDTRIAYAIRNI